MSLGILIYEDDGLFLPIDHVDLNHGQVVFVAIILKPLRRVYNFGGRMRVEGADGSTVVKEIVLGPCIVDNSTGVNNTITVSQPLKWTAISYGGVYPWEPFNWSKYESLFTEIESW